VLDLHLSKQVFFMKKRFIATHILLFASWFSITMSLTGCTTQPPLPSATPQTATAIGRIILGYGDHSPVPDLPLWIGKESHGLPVTRTNEKGEFTLTGLPVGQVIDVVDDHLAFQFQVTSSGIIDVGTFEYPLIHP
jgi:hypothetical protein